MLNESKLIEIRGFVSSYRITATGAIIVRHNVFRTIRKNISKRGISLTAAKYFSITNEITAGSNNEKWKSRASTLLLFLRSILGSSSSLLSFKKNPNYRIF